MSSSGSDYTSSYNSGSWTGVVVTLIISIILAITLVLLLYICAWCLLRRSTARRRSRINQLINEATIMRTYPEEPPLTGLDPSVIHSLPAFSYKELKHHEKNDASRECSVCLSFFQDEEMIRLLPNCKHFFHVECINRWLISNTTCPICRCSAQSPVVALPPEMTHHGQMMGSSDEEPVPLPPPLPPYPPL